MRHLFLTLLITLSFLTSRHHITHSDEFIMYDVYNDELIDIILYESVYFSGKKVGSIFKKPHYNARFRTFFEEERKKFDLKPIQYKDGYIAEIDRFGTFFEEEIYNTSETFNNYIKITEAFKVLPQDSIDKIHPYGIIFCAFPQFEGIDELSEFIKEAIEEKKAHLNTEIIL